MIQSINNHPLTDKKISTDRKRRRKQYISCNANKSSKTKSITHVRFQKCYVIFVIRPFSEIIKDSVKEAVHDGQHPREVNLIKYAENDEKQTNRSIKRHPKDKRLNLIAYISDRIDFLSDVQLRNHFFGLFGLPYNNFLCQPSSISIVKTQISKCPDQRQTHDYPAQNREAQPSEKIRNKCGDDSCLDD